MRRSPPTAHPGEGRDPDSQAMLGIQDGQYSCGKHGVWIWTPAFRDER